MGRRSVSKIPQRKHSEWKEPYEMLSRAKPLSNNNAGLKKAKEKALKWSIQIGKEPYKNHSEKNTALQNAKKNDKTTKKKSSHRRRSTKSSKKKQHLENTDKWHLRKAGSFSYSESPRTPPLEGTSLHRWNNSVERPWGILSLFTTCLRLCVKSPWHSLWHVDYPQKAH